MLDSDVPFWHKVCIFFFVWQCLFQNPLASMNTERNALKVSAEIQVDLHENSILLQVVNS